MDELSIRAVSPQVGSQVLEAAYERCTQIIVDGAPEEVPSAHLVRGRISGMRKDYDAAVKDFALAAASEGPVRFAAARELTLIERYKAGDRLVPGVATGRELFADELAQLKAEQYHHSPSKAPTDHIRALESWCQWSESHGLDLLRVVAEDFVPWLAAQTFFSHAEQEWALTCVLVFYWHLEHQGYMERSPLDVEWAPHMTNLAVQMAENQRAGTDQQGASL